MDKNVSSNKYQVAKRKIQALFAKALFTLVIMLVGIAAYADVPPPKPIYADTSANATVVKSTEGVYNQSIEMATGMRSSGKIYVVVALLTLILLGLFMYLFTLDKKISRLEKEK